MKLLFRTSAFAALLLAIVVLNAAVAAAQDAGTPGPATTGPATVEPVRVEDDENVGRSADVEEADRAWFWAWVWWPTWAGCMILGVIWAYRRFHTSLLKPFVAKLSSGSEERPLDRSPFVQPSAGGLVSGALLLALTTVFFLSQFAIYDYPSDLVFPTTAVDILPWLDFALWLSTLVAPLLVGLLSESRGVWLIPVLGYVFGMALWHASPGENLGNLTYDLSVHGYLLVRVGIPALLMYLAYRFGRVFR